MSDPTATLDTMFPHVITPRPGEWLPGVLLRGDVVNEWSSGTAARLVAVTSHYRKVAALTQYIVNTILRLDLLATSLGVTKETVLGTTFRQEVMQFAATRSPHISQFGDAVPFQVCPACIAEAQMLRRTLAMPYLTTCATHGLQLQEACTCGEALAPFQEAVPFVCGKCGVPWAQLSQVAGTAAEQQRDRSLEEMYDLIWRVGSPTFTLSAWRLVEDALARRGKGKLTLLDGKEHLVGSLDPTTISASLLVLVLSSLEFPAAWVEAVTQPPVAAELRCLNEACPVYEKPQQGNVHLSLARPGSPIWFCTTCGSRFTTQYLVATSDPAVSTGRPPWEYPSPEMIAAEGQRIAAWHARIEGVCEALTREHSQPLLLEVVFRLAEVPQFEWLLAPQLGLRDVVMRYQQRQVEQRCATFREEVVGEIRSHQTGRRPSRRPRVDTPDSFYQPTSFLEGRVGMFDDIPDLPEGEDLALEGEEAEAALNKLLAEVAAEELADADGADEEGEDTKEDAVNEEE